MLYANTSSPGLYWKTRPNQQNRLELCHRYPDIPLRAEPDCIIHLNYREVRTVKQPEQKKSSTTDKLKCSSFQTNYD